MHLCASCRLSYSTTMSAASWILIGLPSACAAPTNTLDVSLVCIVVHPLYRLCNLAPLNQASLREFELRSAAFSVDLTTRSTGHTPAGCSHQAGLVIAETMQQKISDAAFPRSSSP